MKITLKELKQLIREQVEEMSSGIPEARRHPAADEVSVIDPKGLAEFMKKLNYGSKYIALSLKFVLVRDMKIPGQYWPLKYVGEWLKGDGPVVEKELKSLR
jgi:hypothetical protein